MYFGQHGALWHTELDCGTCELDYFFHLRIVHTTFCQWVHWYTEGEQASLKMLFHAFSMMQTRVIAFGSLCASAASQWDQFAWEGAFVCLCIAFFFSSLFMQTPQTSKRKPPDSTNGHKYWLYLHFCIIDLKLWPFTHLSSSLTSRQHQTWGNVVLSLVHSLSSLVCFSAFFASAHSFIPHSSLLCFLHTPSCLFPLALSASVWWRWAAADCCRWSEALQTAGGRGETVWGS